MDRTSRAVLGRLHRGEGSGSSRRPRATCPVCALGLGAAVGLGAGSGGCQEWGVTAWMWPRGPGSAEGSAGLPGGSPFQSRPGRSEMKCSLRGSRRTLWGPNLLYDVDICWVGGCAHESPSPRAPGSRGKEGRGRWCGCSSWGRGGLNLLLR